LDRSAYLERADPGECEAIALAEVLGADKILLDDREDRELDRERHLKVCGVLGELLHAQEASRIVSVREEMDRLQSEARFLIREDLKALITWKSDSGRKPPDWWSSGTCGSATMAG
jgi:predicted nucleic acid-binding protein